MISLTPRRGTNARTATQSGSASGAIVGDSNPGVIGTPCGRGCQWVALNIFGNDDSSLPVGQAATERYTIEPVYMPQSP